MKRSSGRSSAGGLNFEIKPVALVVLLQVGIDLIELNGEVELPLQQLQQVKTNIDGCQGKGIGVSGGRGE